MKLRCIIILVMYVLLTTIVFPLEAQELNIDTSRNITRCLGNDQSPAWSHDGKKLLFQSDRNGNWDIFMYNTELDTVVQLTEGKENERNPCWFPGEKAICYDAGEEAQTYLYKKNLQSGDVMPVFSRNIICKDASFTRDGRMIYFLGYSKQYGKWELYSYHYVYDVLNKLADDGDNIVYYNLSPDAKRVLYGYETYPYPYRRMRIINWYSEPEERMEDYNVTAAEWYPGGLKIYFISDKDEFTGELYSMWQDKTHLRRLTEDDYEIKDFAISPDGITIACSVLLDGNYEIIIITPEPD